MTKDEAIKELSLRIDACERCRYHQGQRAVPGEGSVDAKIVFVGEAPGSKENETGRPFVGSAGKFLDEMLNSIGLEREDVFITNVIKFQPPENRDPTPEEISFQLPFLQKQLAVIKPRLVVFLGRHALRAVLSDISGTISELHGRLIKVDNQHYLPLYHPAAALYNGSLRTTLTNDFKKIPEYMDIIDSDLTNS